MNKSFLSLGTYSEKKDSVSVGKKTPEALNGSFGELRELEKEEADTEITGVPVPIPYESPDKSKKGFDSRNGKFQQGTPKFNEGSHVDEENEKEGKRKDIPLKKKEGNQKSQEGLVKIGEKREVVRKANGQFSKSFGKGQNGANKGKNGSSKVKEESRKGGNGQEESVKGKSEKSRSVSVSVNSQRKNKNEENPKGKLPRKAPGKSGIRKSQEKEKDLKQSRFENQMELDARKRLQAKTKKERDSFGENEKQKRTASPSLQTSSIDTLNQGARPPWNNSMIVKEKENPKKTSKSQNPRATKSKEKQLNEESLEQSKKKEKMKRTGESEKQEDLMTEEIEENDQRRSEDEDDSRERTNEEALEPADSFDNSHIEKKDSELNEIPSGDNELQAENEGKSEKYMASIAKADYFCESRKRE